MGRRISCIMVIPGCLLMLILAGCDPVALRAYIEKMTGFENIIYVSASTGDDTSRGVLGEPLATIQAGIEKASEYIDDDLAETVDVYVAEGTYEVTNGIEDEGDYIAMVEGISLYGGYSADFSERDSTVYISKIIDVSTEGEDVAAVRAYDGLTTATVLDGFTIQGGKGSGGIASNALDIERASPTISNNVILGGDALDDGLVLALDIYDNASPVIDGNTIIGGSSPGSNIALAISDSSNPVVQNNTINGGTAGSCTAIMCWSTQALIENNSINGGEGAITTGVNILQDCFVSIQYNTIEGGSASNSSQGIRNQSTMVNIIGNSISGGCSETGNAEGIYNDTGSSFNIWHNTIFGGEATGDQDANGIRCESASGQICNNTIAGGVSNWSAGILLRNDSTPTIENNIIFSFATVATPVCIHESDTNGAYADSIKNNCLWDMTGAGTTILYDPWNDPGITDITTLNTNYDHADANLEEDPLFEKMKGLDNDIATISHNDYHLTTSTPAGVKTGGLDQADAGGNFIYDRDGNARTGNGTTGWSMGAYEKD